MATSLGCDLLAKKCLLLSGDYNESHQARSALFLLSESERMQRPEAKAVLLVEIWENVSGHPASPQGPV